MRRRLQRAFASPLAAWTGTGLVVVALVAVFFNGSTVLQAIHSPLVTSKHKAWTKCVLRVWDAEERLNINAECGIRPRRWIWESSKD